MAGTEFAIDNAVTTSVAGNFIPELWSDEVIGSYKSNLVLANLVTRINHKGKKGDTIHIPAPNRGSASAKGASDAVTIQNTSNSVVNISLDKHYEYSRLVEDIAEVQALSSMRKFYTDDAGYALAKQVDSDLFATAETLQGGTAGGSGAALWETAVIGSDGSTAFNGATSNAADITDAGIRAMILTLDNADIPMDERALVIPPVASNDLLAINRFTEQQYIGDGEAIKTGKIGMIYGVDVYVSTNAPSITAAGGSPTACRVGLLAHKSALALAEQMSIRSQTQYKQEYLGDLYTSDCIYGVGELRNDGGVAFVVPSS